MLNRYTNDYIKEIIQYIMTTANIDLEIRPDESGINMSYNFIGHYIGVDFTRLISAWEEMDAPLSLDSYIKTLTIHELGHAVDRAALLESLERTIEIFRTKNSNLASEIYNDRELLSMLMEEHEMNIIFEETAWMNAERLNADFNFVDHSTLSKVRKHSLTTYQRLYLADLKRYEILSENPDVKTA